MNAQQMESAESIIENLKAIKGDDFTRIVLVATQAGNMCGMLANYDPTNEQHRDMMRDAMSTTLARLMAEVTTAYKFDPKEITHWADTLQAAIDRHGATQH